MPQKLKLLAAISLLFTGATRAQLAPPASYRMLADQIYSTVNGWEGKMDIYLPEQQNKPVPLVIYIHGGGWVHGKKEDEKEFSLFFDQNYAVANIEYRLADVAPAPAAITDCRCALFYLLNHARDLNLDTRRIIVMGASAGGHLALMTGLLGNDHRFDSNCSSSVKFRVVAIVDRSGPADLNRWESIRLPSKASSSWLGGRSGDTVFVNTLSPVSYVSRNSPPTLIIHGDKDHTVPFQQSETLYAKMKAAGEITEFEIIAGATHAIYLPADRAHIADAITKFVTTYVGQ